MPDNFRLFEAADPFERRWRVRFLWQQNAISIRHGDAVDVTFALNEGAGECQKAIALPHPYLLALSAKTGRPITDPWCARLAAAHLAHMIETWTDMEKPLVTPALEELEGYAARK